LAGKNESACGVGVVWSEDTCDVCERLQVVCDPRYWGYFTPEQITQAKSKLKEFGLDRHSFADPGDVRRLIGVIREVLGEENMSYMLKLCIKGIEIDMDRGKNIAMFDSRQLAYWYGKDVEFLNSKRERERNEILQPKTHLSIVQGGRERLLDNS
jgi:hypothetical protein